MASMAVMLRWAANKSIKFLHLVEGGTSEAASWHREAGALSANMRTKCTPLTPRLFFFRGRLPLTSHQELLVATPEQSASGTQPSGVSSFADFDGCLQKKKKKKILIIDFSLCTPFSIDNSQQQDNI
jgi:hypothetical protein